MGVTDKQIAFLLGCIRSGLGLKVTKQKHHVLARLTKHKSKFTWNNVVNGYNIVLKGAVTANLEQSQTIRTDLQGQQGHV